MEIQKVTMSDNKKQAEAPEAPKWKDSFTMIKREGVIFRLVNNPGSQDGTYSKVLGEILIKAHKVKGLPAILEVKTITKAERIRRSKLKPDHIPEPTYYLYVATGSPRTILAPLTTDGGDELREKQAAAAGASQEVDELTEELEDLKTTSFKVQTTMKEKASKELSDAKEKAATDLKTAKDKHALEVEQYKAVIKGLSKKSFKKLVEEFFTPKSKK